MNKTIKHSYHTLGEYVAVKLNVKLSNAQFTQLINTYTNWLQFIPFGSDGKYTRIEGVLPKSSIDEFKYELRQALLQSKIDFLTLERTQHMRSRFLPPPPDEINIVI